MTGQNMPVFKLAFLAGCCGWIFASGTWPAFAGSTTAIFAVLNNCQNSALTADVRLEACSELIHSNLANHSMLGVFYAIRAGIYQKMPDYALALRDYDKAIELTPDLPQPFNNRAIIYQKLGKLQEAAAGFQQAGLLHRKQDDCATAIKEFSEALNDNPKQAMSLYVRGICKTSLGDASGGQADIAAASEMDSDVASKFEGAK